MKSIVAMLIVALSIGVAPARADQQKWSSSYVGWEFAAGAPPAWMIDQDVWIPEKSVARFFTVNWDFTAGDNGYLGLQSDDNGVGNVRFSLWNATEARGPACRNFDGEGVGKTCELPFTIDPNAVYRLRLWRTNADASGQWWAGYVISRDSTGRVVETRIGEIKVGRTRTEITTSSILNFSEYWGDAFARCKDVPASVAVYMAPSINKAGSGRYAATPLRPTPSTPEGNVCSTGREKAGAFVRDASLTLAGVPAMVLVLGGERAVNDALAARIAKGPKPAPMPAS